MVPALADRDDPMFKLSDTQAIILSAAAQRPDGNLLPLPGSLRGGAAGKVVGALLSRGLAHEQVIDSPRKADAALNTIWHNEEDGRAVLLFATPAGLDAIGVESEPNVESETADAAPAANPGGEAPKLRFEIDPTYRKPTTRLKAEARAKATVESSPKKAGRPKKATPSAPKAAAKTRDGTKQAQLIAMLRRKEGATIAQIVEATGWQPHTVRGAFAGALKKKLGLTVTSEKVEGVRVYRIL